MLSGNKVLAHLAAECYHSQHSFSNDEWEANMAELYKTGNEEQGDKDDQMAFANLVLVAMDDARQDRGLRSQRALGAYGAKKYKPVALKQNPIPVSVPEVGPAERAVYEPIPIPKLPTFPTHPPKRSSFRYTPKITPERLDMIVRSVPENFLSEEEIDLLVWVVGQNQDAFAFDDSERGTFDPKYFPDYVMETVKHDAWQQAPIRIPEALKQKVTEMLNDQLKSGNLEHSRSSYRSRIFVVLKPSGGLRIVHDLQPLNKVSVQDAMLPPNVTEFAESFVGRAIYGTMDLYSGYHQRRLHEQSRPLSACNTLIGNMQLTSLPMGYTNSMQEFQRSTSHTIAHMAPERAGAFVDDIGVKGPRSRYENMSIKENPRIRRFVWEYAHTLYEMLATMRAAGCTAAGAKFVLATPVVHIVGSLCSLDGRLPHHGIITKILNWPRPKDPTGVRGLIGTASVARNWIKDFAKIAKPLTELTKLQKFEFEWNEKAEKAMIQLKEAITTIPALRTLDLQAAMDAPRDAPEGKPGKGQVILAVDSSIIAAGYILSQIFEDGRHPILYGSITWNDVESRYSQPKIELYGLYRALTALRYQLWGLPVLVEVDAISIKQMANSPGLPNAAMTRWVSYIQLFDIRWHHVPAERHKAPDGLSRRERAPEDSDNSEDDLEPDEGGQFISGPRPNDPIAPMWIEPDREDETYLSHTRLRVRDEEPLDLIQTLRHKDVGSVFHVAAITPQPGSDRVTWSYQAIAMPANENPIENDSDDEDTDEDVDSESSEQGGSSLDHAKGKTNRRKERSDADPLHEHHTYDDNRLQYWENILQYLRTLKVPKEVKNRKSFIQATRKYFLYDDRLWRRAPDVPRLVVLNLRRREEIIKQAHDESGHRGRDPTYKKISDSYFWPNMLAQVAVFCRTCVECQLRSVYRPRVQINPTWVPTILRKFNIDVVFMNVESGGFKYFVDARDDLTGWMEAKPLRRKSAQEVASFIFKDIICRFGCIIQMTADNGGEFRGATEILLKKYGVKVVHTSPRHPEANGMSERGHRTWVESIWKLCGRDRTKWIKWFYPALWADRITTKRTTGYSPYYLLYGRPHLFPYAMTDQTWYTLPWHEVRNTRDLIAMRAIQIQGLTLERKGAAKANLKARMKAAEEYAFRNKARLVSGEYRKNELVLVAQKEMIENNDYAGTKASDRWAGPFQIEARNESGSYRLRELNGAKIKGSVAAAHLKPFYSRNKKARLTSDVMADESSDEEHPLELNDPTRDEITEDLGAQLNRTRGDESDEDDEDRYRPIPSPRK